MAGYQSPTGIVGVDFSAASRDAGRNTWIAEGCVEDGGLEIEALADAASFLECDADRGSTLDALANWIRKHADENVAFGLDFPFGLPLSLLDGDEEWRAFLDGTPDRWGALEDVDGPTSLYEKARTVAAAHADGLFRETDRENGGQEPTGYRIKAQTYYGVSELLAAIADDVAIPPMDDPDGRPVVLETYPACTFEELDDAVRSGYKRDTRDAIDARRRNVTALSKTGVDFSRYDEYAVASDDALDAVAAAYATYEATRDPSTLEVTGGGADGGESSYRREGYIYGGASEGD